MDFKLLMDFTSIIVFIPVNGLQINIDFTKMSGLHADSGLRINNELQANNNFRLTMDFTQIVNLILMIDITLNSEPHIELLPLLFGSVIAGNFTSKSIRSLSNLHGLNAKQIKIN